ncbi:MAG: hypothetical protein R3D80_04175 [Paracoccaceae bacterium]
MRVALRAEDHQTQLHLIETQMQDRVVEFPGELKEIGLIALRFECGGIGGRVFLRPPERDRRLARRAVDGDVDQRIGERPALGDRPLDRTEGDALAGRLGGGVGKFAGTLLNGRVRFEFGITSSTRSQSLARLPRTPSSMVENTSARSRRTLRLSVTRVRPPVPGRTASSGTSGSATEDELSSVSMM